MPTLDEPSGLCPNPKPIEVYSSFNSALPTNISLRKKLRGRRRKTEKPGLTNGEALCSQKRITASKSRSIMPQNWTVPKREMHTDMFLLVVLLRKCLKLSLAVFLLFIKCVKVQGVSLVKIKTQLQLTTLYLCARTCKLSSLCLIQY